MFEVMCPNAKRELLLRIVGVHVVSLAAPPVSYVSQHQPFVQLVCCHLCFILLEWIKSEEYLLETDFKSIISIHLS
jgi:hypothetical protein